MKEYAKGILGGIFGGLVTTIPWVLMYVYGGYILSVLAALIAYGVQYGYSKLEGKIDRHFSLIIAGVSIFVVVIVSLVIIPLMLLKQDGYFATFGNLQILYQNQEFLMSMLKDLAVSVLFTIVGVVLVIRSNKKIKNI